MKPTDDKNSLFRDMQNNPDGYSDEQIEAMMEELDHAPNTEAEWETFAANHFAKERRIVPFWLSKAAAVIAIIIVSGIVYAATVAVGIVPSPFAETDSSNETISNTTTSVADTIVTNTKVEESVVFDNAPLSQILAEFSAYYHVKIEYVNVNSKSLRLFFKWNKGRDLSSNIEALNAFERICISQNDSILTIE
ncbi:MAG: DUF4974 domain-containing protein [Prevotellaceae bacterium]|nr:DUF4974 domain-containing protein [Candidatus Minthosoma caballi]